MAMGDFKSAKTYFIEASLEYGKAMQKATV